MKVVLFCGGFGMRLREYSENIPKPMVPIGYRPVLWHVMKYYAHYGHKEFILCLGYKADEIKNYFLNYNECLSNDFTLAKGCKQLQLLSTDIHDWRITFVDTGLSSNIGQRLKAVEKHLDGESVFFANYADGLTDLPLPKLLDHFHNHHKLASFLCVKPNQSFHVVSTRNDDTVAKIQHIGASDIWMNGGYYIFAREIFNYINQGEELVGLPFQRLIDENQIVAYKYSGFWTTLDTFKDKQQIDEMYAQGDVPWEVWRRPRELDRNEVRLQSDGLPVPRRVRNR